MPVGKLRLQAKSSSVSNGPIVAARARDRRRVGAQPLERQVEGVAAVIHRDAAARVAPLAPPVGAPAGDALGVRVAERLQRHQVDLADPARLDDAAHRLHDRRVLVVVAGVQHALGALRVAQHRARLLDASPPAASRRARAGRDRARRARSPRGRWAASRCRRSRAGPPRPRAAPRDRRRCAPRARRPRPRPGARPRCRRWRRSRRRARCAVSGGVPLLHDEAVTDHGPAQLLRPKHLYKCRFRAPGQVMSHTTAHLFENLPFAAVRGEAG